MDHLGIPEWFLLAYLCFLLPWAAARSRARVRGLESIDPAERAATAAQLPKGLVRLMLGTLISLTALGWLCWIIAPGWRYDLLGGRPVDARAAGLGVVALALSFGLFAIARHARTPEERARLFVRRLVPKAPAEWAMMIVVIAAAAFAEEAAYRGLGMLFLSIVTRNAWLAAAILALAFGAAHAPQGWKSMIVIVPMALLMHALVALTGTLVVAMLVHFVYDIVAVALTKRILEREAAAAPRATAA